MKGYRGYVLIALGLLATSAGLYWLQWELFHDVRDALFYLLQDLAFLPVQVLLVAMVVEGVLAQREKNRLLQKMNMVIGTFFSEVGTKLLGELSHCVENGQAMRGFLGVRADWTASEWKRALAAAETFDYDVRVDASRLAAIERIVSQNRPFVTLLLANPNLMEHERFTDLLWAVVHVTEELAARHGFENLPPSDLSHLSVDVKRVYSQLTVQWLLYCRHLQNAYPYIFSIIVRTHPLQDSPSAIVR